MMNLASSMTHTLRKWNVPIITLALFLGLAMSCTNALAQSGAGSVQGTVTDQTGAVIPNASVHIVNPATNAASDAKSNAVGFYQVPDLFTATYSITVTAPGFKTSKTSLELLVAQNAIVNIQMTPGAVTQNVEVEASMVQLTTSDNGTIASTLESTRINQLPMNGRTLVSLAGEATPGLESGGTRANGLMGEALEYVADGVPLANRQFGGVNLSQTQIPDPDAVQEVRIETTNTGAQYAEPATGIITTKSGTNSLHGALFETARNNAIGIAKNRNNLSTFAAPHLVRNEFGASAGGPVIIPHVYHGKDKTFWFYAYERYSLASPTSELAAVAPVAQRTGNFSGYTNTSGAYQQLYDPATTSNSNNCNGTGTANAYCRAPFGNGILGDPGNNIIPTSRLSPTMKIIYDITPLPTNSSNPMAPGSGGANISVANPTYNEVPTHTFRIDQEFNEANRAYLRYTSNVLRSVSLRNYTSAGMNNPATIAADGFPQFATGIAYNPSASYSGALGYTHVFSPTFFSETIISQQWLGQHNFAGGTPTADFEKQLGTPNNFGEGGFPAFGSGELQGGLWGYGGTQFIYGLSQIVQNADENLTKTMGKHQLMFGGRFRHERFGDLPDESSDQVQFNGSDTALENPGSGTAYSGTSNTGGDDPDAFLGGVSYYSVTQEPPYSHFHDYEFDAYFQDNWHVSRNLTANLGLRWEDHPAAWTKYGLYNAFDYKNDAMVLQAPFSTLIAEGYTTQAIENNMAYNGAKYETPQQAGMPSVLMRNYPLTFSPRVGLAWQPFNGKHGTVIRGAYGRYIYPMPTRSFLKNVIGNNPLVAGYSQNFNSAAQTDGLPNAELRYPSNGTASWQYPTSTQAMSSFLPIMGENSTNNVNSATTTSLLPGTSLWNNSSSMPPDFVTQMNFTIEQPLKGNTALRLTWLWSHGTNLDHYYYINNHPSSFVWETAYGIVPPTGGASVIGTSAQNTYSSTATGPYDQTTWGGNTYDVKDGWSNDNAFQATYQRLYVWSKPFRLGGNYFRDGTVDPLANYEGVLGSAGSWNTNAIANEVVSPVTAPYIPKAGPQGTLPWQEYHSLVKFEEYKVDTAIPKQHITFNGIVDLPVGRGKKFLGGVNRFEDEIVGGWQIAGDGQVVSQDFGITSSNWGPTNPIKYYKNGVTVTDCSGSQCQKEKMWFNGYIVPTAAAMGKISGLPSGYTAGTAASPAYSSPIAVTINPQTGAFTGTNNNVNIVLANGTVQTQQGYSPGPLGSNPYSQTILNGPINYSVDLSLFKVFPITEKTMLRFNVDAFNALNIQGYGNPNGTTGEIAFQPNGLSSSYNTPRQLQFTLRLQF